MHRFPADLAEPDEINPREIDAAEVEPAFPGCRSLHAKFFRHGIIQ